MRRARYFAIATGLPVSAAAMTASVAAQEAQAETAGLGAFLKANPVYAIGGVIIIVLLLLMIVRAIKRLSGAKKGE